MSPRRTNTIVATDQFLDLHFPFAGLEVSDAFFRQRPVQMPNGEYHKTCRQGINVWGWEPLTGRMRGGSRAMLSKYVATAPVADWIIQELALLVTVGTGGGVQLSNSGRIVTVVAVSQGNVYTAVAAATAWTIATNSTGVTPPLNFSGVMQSTALNQKLWFADGVNYVFYDPSVNTVFRWAASFGSLPADSRGNTPRLIATWRGRIVMSGLLYDPQNWFMSAVGDPTDWDYNPLEVTPTQAIAGNNSPVGIVGDVITALIPYSDDVLIFGSDHEIYMMNGDPMAGGQIDRVSDSIGIAWGKAWCKDPYGTIYFVSNKTGVYSLVPGQQPQRMSQQIEQLLQPYDTGLNQFRMEWNDRYQGFFLFITPLSAPASTTHYFWEWRSNAWWQVQFANTNHDPLATCVFDGNLPGDRVMLIGSWDGFVRFFDPNAVTDDGTVCSSSVVLGPINTQNMDEMLLKELQAAMGANSGTVTYSVFVGSTAEIALNSTAVSTGTWTSGRNLDTLIRRAGHAVYVKLTSTVPWQLEQIRAKIATQGKVRMRGY